MEVDSEAPRSVMAPSATGSVSVSLHPLVIMNISEHWTRVRAQEGKPTQGMHASAHTSVGHQFGSCHERGNHLGRIWGMSQV